MTRLQLRLASVLVGLCSIVFAQSDTAAIAGVVRDATGLTVPSATVTVRNEATQLERRVATDQQGRYIATNLPPGYYMITVEAPGFKRYESTNNKLDANVNATVNVNLTVGQVTESVQVVATAPQVQSDTATVGKVVTTDQIQNLSLNGRNPLMLALLKPGVRGGSLAGFTFGLSSGGFSINGSRSQDNLITFDGAPAVRTRANGTSVGTADLETVQEIQILTSNYNAEYGRAGGGQIRMITRSGSRDFHGSAYEYFRNNVLDANSWDRNRAGLDRTAQRFNQFGYIVSGPAFIPKVWNQDRNKLFFLWSQEWVRRRREETSIQTVPSLAMRQGNFSELLNPSNPFFGRVRTIIDPLTGQPFPNNIIPQNRLSPSGIGLLRAYPEPTPGFQQGDNNFIQTRPRPEDQRKDTISLDFLPVESHMFRFRHQIYNWTAVDAFRGGFDRAVTDWDRPNKTASLNYIWTVGPTLINEALATASVDRVYIGIFRSGLYERSRYGINYPYLFPERKEIFDKIPTITMNNFTTLDGGPYPASSTGPIYTISDTLTWIRGAHTLKFGGFFERAGQNDFDQINVTGVPGGTNNQNGRFVFSDNQPGATGVAIANAALGRFDTYAEIGPRAFTPYRSHMFEWFAQDSWKATNRLNLEFGVRWTYVTPYYYSLWRNMAVFDPSRYDPNRAAVLDPTTGAVLRGDRYNGVVIPGSGWPDAARGRVPIADTGEFDYLFSGGDPFYGKRQWGNFAPRVGVAYAINDRTVFRAGGGRFFARPGVSDNIFLGGNPPFQPMVSITSGSVDNPAGGSRTAFPQFFMTQDPVYKVPEAWNWSATFERNIGFNTVVSVGYVGRVGLHLERERELNALRPGTVQANRGIDQNYLRPYKGFAFIPMNENAARSEYNGLQLELNKRYSQGLSFGVAYTLSKSLDNASGRRDRMYNPFDDRSYWGPSSFDTRHVAVINFIWDLPFLRNNSSVAGKLLGNWQLTGVTQFQSGTPFTIGTNDDFAGIGRNDFQPWEVQNFQYVEKFADSNSDPDQYFTATATRPAQGTFSSTQTRNQFYNPGFQNWNLSLFKNFPIVESHSVQLRVDAFNWINHPNWSGATTNPTSSVFGKVTSKSSERNIQLSLRYSF